MRDVFPNNIWYNGCSIKGTACCSGYTWDTYRGRWISEFNASMHIETFYLSKYACYMQLFYQVLNYLELYLTYHQLCEIDYTGETAPLHVHSL